MANRRSIRETVPADGQATGADTLPSSAALRRAMLGWGLLAAIVALAIALRSLLPANTDVSWLLIVCDKILGGQRLYADIIETNPPIAVWAYMPCVVVGRLLHLRAEVVLNAMVFLGASLSMSVTALMLRRSSAFRAQGAWPFVLMCVAIVLVMPMQAFGQREHIAAIGFLPAMAGYVLRAERRDLSPWQIAVAGLGAGITMAFKPYFVLAAGAAIVAAALNARTWRALLAPENVIAAGVVIAYGLATYAFYPAYFMTIFPLVRDVYLPLKRPVSELVLGNGVLISAAALVVTALAIRSPRPPAATAVLIAATIGFGCAYILQRKGWPYQSCPMLMFALIVLARQLSLPTAAPRASRVGGFICLAGLMAAAMIWMDGGSNADILQPAVRQLGPHPRILALTAEPSIGHPLTRAVGGQWVSRQQALWVREAVNRLKAGAYGDVRTDGLDAYAARERAWLIEDIERTPPTVILVDNLLSDWGAWAQADPFFAKLLTRYHRVETIQHIDILALRDTKPSALQK